MLFRSFPRGVFGEGFPDGISISEEAPDGCMEFGGDERARAEYDEFWFHGRLLSVDGIRECPRGSGWCPSGVFCIDGTDDDLGRKRDFCKAAVSFEDGCGENGRAVHGKEESPDGVGASCCEDAVHAAQGLIPFPKSSEIGRASCRERV